LRASGKERRTKSWEEERSNNDELKINVLTPKKKLIRNNKKREEK